MILVADGALTIGLLSRQVKNRHSVGLDRTKDEVADRRLARRRHLVYRLQLLDRLLEVVQAKVRKTGDLLLTEVLSQHLPRERLRLVHISQQYVAQLDDLIELLRIAGLFRLILKLRAVFELARLHEGLLDPATIEFREQFFAARREVGPDATDSAP